jgi:L-threonylcarbamoyladenylate synthase
LNINNCKQIQTYLNSPFAIFSSAIFITAFHPHSQYFCCMSIEQDIQSALQILRSGGIILYPTDTVWSIGCDATSESAVKKIYELKQRPAGKIMTVLVASERDIIQYVAAPDMEVFNYLNSAKQPTTVVYQGAIGLADNLIADEGSIGVRIVQDEFCRHLIKRFGKPIVSASANLAGIAVPGNFSEIDPVIINNVGYVVQYRQQESAKHLPAAIVKWNADGSVTVIRE